MYLLNQGDLHQMGVQELFLRQHGFNVHQVDVFPAIKTKEEYIDALKAIYRNYVDGWWNYKDHYVRYGICTEEEFKKKFTASMKGR